MYRFLKAFLVLMKLLSLSQFYAPKLNHIHNINSHNTDDGGKAMGEELRHVQMSRWIMHIRWEK